jgi:hypothetical protein
MRAMRRWGEAEGGTCAVPRPSYKQGAPPQMNETATTGLPKGVWTGPADRMPEAEVALRLAEYLSERPGFGGHVEVAVDGASVRVGETEVFDIIGYLAWAGWAQDKAGTGRKIPGLGYPLSSRSHQEARQPRVSAPHDSHRAGFAFRCE